MQSSHSPNPANAQQLDLLDLLSAPKTPPVQLQAEPKTTVVEVGQQPKKEQEVAVVEPEPAKPATPLLDKIQQQALKELIEDFGAIPEPVAHNQHEVRQALRQERYGQASENASRRSDESFKGSNDALAGIEPGQPILVGHHSEKHHRRAVEKSHNHMRQSVDESRKASYYADKAKSVGKAGISSTDPDAERKLKLKLLDRMIDQELMKTANAIIRSKSKKKYPDKSSKIRELATLGIGNANAEKLFEPYLGKTGFQSYLLTNNNGVMRQTRQRIEQVRKLQASESEQRDYSIADDFAMVSHSLDEGLVTLENDREPSKAVKAIYSSHSFRWSPKREQWVRKLTDNAIAAVSLIEMELKELGADAFWPTRAGGGSRH